MALELELIDFQSDVLEKKGVSIVFFHANWCRNCRSLLPILEDLEESLYPNLQLITVDVEKHVSFSDDHDVVSLPTSLVFKDGVLVDSVFGLHSKDYFEELLKNV